MIEAFEKWKLTHRKLFGQYYHALVCHAPQQYRIMSLPSANAEDEEQMFNFLKTASTWTSNHHADHVLDNAFIRLQIREEYNDEKMVCLMVCKRIKTTSTLTKTGEKLPPRVESLVSYGILNTYPKIWQAHLERIADFLLVLGVWNETSDGEFFHDLKELS